MKRRATSEVDDDATTTLKIDQIEYLPTLRQHTIYSEYADTYHRYDYTSYSAHLH